jgi:HD-GYP domain-containing protein (c-di-GMP phosphodiesterase class II)
MKNQFIYTAVIAEKEYKASFNIEKVIRSLTEESGNVIVILDDFNERVTQQPDIDLKTNKFKGYKNVRETVQSEIQLTPEDGERFYKLTEFNV